MSFATDKWFRHVREELLTEGLGDIGLSEDNVNRIRMELPDASEKGRVWVGNALKDYGTRTTHGPRITLRAQIREDYKDIEEAYKDKFQKGDFNILTQYMKVISGQPIKKWPKAKKSFIKNSRKLGVSDAIINTVTLFVDEVEGKVFSEFASRLQSIFVTLNQNPNNYEIIKDYPPAAWDEAEEECFHFQQNQEDPDDILHTFEDGSYWYDLNTSNCKYEGERMGHCGRDNRGGLYSLRKRGKGKKESKSYVTISYNAYESTIYQIKGRSNTCPPEEMWPHIEWFIEEMHATKLEETGEYSSEEDEFQVMGQHLADATGIEFEGGIDARINELRDECESYLGTFQRKYSDQAVRSGLDIDADDFGAGFQPYWADSLEEICVELPFRFLNKESLGYEVIEEEIIEEIQEAIDSEDRKDLFQMRWADQPELFFTKANSYEDAIRKSNNHYGNTESGAAAEGENTYLVLMSLDSSMTEWFNDNNGDTFSSDGYLSFLEGIEELIEDVGDALDEIEGVLVEAGLVAKPKVKGYVEKVEGEFNNFQISTYKATRGEYRIIATGIAIKTTQDEMDTLLGPVSFVETFRGWGGYKTSSGYYTSPLFKAEVIDELSSHQAQAVKFAKSQMKLNYGEQYEEKIENFWDKMSENNKLFYDSIFIGFGIKYGSKGSRNPARRPPPGSVIDSENYFSYKMEVILNEKTLPFYGPFLEYYDNNFQLVIDAFDDAIKEQIRRAVRKFKKETGNDTNLPLQEVESPFDVRVYEIDFVMSYPLGQGFEITDIHNIIRAIPDVTTIRSIGHAKRTQGNRTASLQHLKFALQGQRSRMDWVQQILLPQIRKIDNRIRIHKVERAELVSSSKSLRENWSTPYQRQSPAMVTPRATIRQTLEDWVQGGVMYDSPMHTNLSSYHVMVPVEELEPYMSRQARKHGHHFDAGYENFIANGPVQPIYLAIGKNGRVKITGNEDDLRYALKAGVKEVPVFFSYQRQV